MQLKRKWIVSLMAVVLLATAACVPQAAPTPSAGEMTPAYPVPGTGSEPTPAQTGEAGGEDPLAGTRWTLVSFGAGDTETPVVGDTDLTLNFDSEGRASGQGGCNSFSAGYTVDGDSITFEPIASTLMACADENVMQQETDFYNALNSASRFVLDDDRLTIETEGQGTLIFERQ